MKRYIAFCEISDRVFAQSEIIKTLGFFFSVSHLTIILKLYITHFHDV